MSKNKQGADNALNDIKEKLEKDGLQIKGGYKQAVSDILKPMTDAVESLGEVQTPNQTDLMELVNDSINQTVQNQVELPKPLISIVTIFNDENAQKWLASYMKGIALLKLHGENAPLIEIVLCKTIRDDKAKQNGTLKKPEITELDGKLIRHAEYIYNGEFDFADARNAAKHWATGEWIISLDTDEHLIPKQFQDLVELIGTVPQFVGGIKFTILSHIPFSVNGLIDYHREHLSTVRMFRNDKNILWKSRIHETPSFSIQDNKYQINDSVMTIIHEGYEINIEGLIGKLERNLKALKIEYCTATDKNVIAHVESYLEVTVVELRKLKSQ